MDKQKIPLLSDRPVSVDTVFAVERLRCVTAQNFEHLKNDRRTAATRLAHFLILGRVKTKFSHLLEKPYGPPSIGEIRKLYVWLLMIMPEHIDLIGGDNVVLDAIERWQAHESA